MTQHEQSNYKNVHVDIEYVMARYGLNLSAARVLKVIDGLVKLSRQRGVKDKRGVPYCYASKEWIAGKIGKSLRTVARAIADLKAAGVIECKRTKSNAMLFITGYEIYGPVEAEATAAAEPVAVAEPATAAAEPVAMAEPVAAAAEPVGVAEPATVGEETTSSAEAEPCYACETATNGTSCEGAAEPVFAMNGTSGSDKNGTSKYSTKSYNNKAYNPSIVQSPRAREERAYWDEVEREERREQEKQEREERGTLWCKVHVTLMENLLWYYQRYEGGLDVFHQATEVPIRLIATYVADAVSGDKPIRVNGALISPQSYWSIVKELRNDEALMETLERVQVEKNFGLIKNLRAYILSALYNCAIWQTYDRHVAEDENYRERRLYA